MTDPKDDLMQACRDAMLKQAEQAEYDEDMAEIQASVPPRSDVSESVLDGGARRRRRLRKSRRSRKSRKSRKSRRSRRSRRSRKSRKSRKLRRSRKQSRRTQKRSHKKRSPKRK